MSYDGQLVKVVLDPISVIVNYALKIAKKNWIDDLSKIGLQIGKLNDDLHILVHNGEEIFRGNKKQLKETLEGYLKKGKDLNKYLDELVEIIKKRKAALIKYSDKFDENFINHLSGDIAIEKITIFFRDLYYIGTKGQGGHWMNKFLKIDSLVPPPNYSSVADIPFETPFRARVSIKSLKGKLFPKDAVSTIFPKNWSKERIAEEVAYVYENTVAKGKGLNPDSLKKLLRQYKFKDSNGKFDIIIEVDDLGKIMNSYPKI